MRTLKANLLTFIFILVSFMPTFSQQKESKTVKSKENIFTNTINKLGDKQISVAKHPEFAFQLPEMAGNLKFGVIVGDHSKWCSDTKQVRSEFKNNILTYRISDPILGKGSLTFNVISLSNTDGILIEVSGDRLPENTQLLWAFGGAYGKLLNENDQPTLKPEFCKYNVFSVEWTAFTVYYGESMRLRVIQGVMPISSEIRLSDAHQQESPLAFFNSGKKTDAPALAATVPLENGGKDYFCIYKQNAQADYNYYMLPELFEKEISSNK